MSADQQAALVDSLAEKVMEKIDAATPAQKKSVKLTFYRAFVMAFLAGGGAIVLKVYVMVAALFAVPADVREIAKKVEGNQKAAVDQIITHDRIHKEDRDAAIQNSSAIQEVKLWKASASEKLDNLQNAMNRIENKLDKIKS